MFEVSNVGILSWTAIKWRCKVSSADSKPSQKIHYELSFFCFSEESLSTSLVLILYFEDATMKEETLIFYAMLCAAILLGRVPLIGPFFRVINTMVHETGHALTTLLFSGKVYKIELFSDLSGTTISSTKGKFARIIVSLIGYPFSTAMAWLMFYLLYHQQQRAVIILFTGMSLFCLIFFVRNIYGVIWLCAFIILNVAALYFLSYEIIYWIALIFSVLLLGDAVASVLLLLILSIKAPRKSGDAHSLRQLTGIHEVVWSLLFAAFALWIAYDIIIKFFPKFPSLPV